MGIFGRLFRCTPKEELNGIKLNLDEPFWELTGKTDFPALFRALHEILPENSILYFEGGSPSGQLLDFLNTKSVPEQTHVAVSTIWPRPDYYHVPATAENISRLADISENIAEPELAVHFHIYCKGEVVLQWHDVFSDPMLLSCKLAEENVRTFAHRLNLKVTKWKNESEQMARPDGE